VITEFFFQVVAKDSLIKYIFEEEKSLIVENDLFSENSAQLGVFCLKRGLQANRRAVRKSAIFPQPSNQKQLN